MTLTTQNTLELPPIDDDGPWTAVPTEQVILSLPVGAERPPLPAAVPEEAEWPEDLPGCHRCYEAGIIEGFDGETYDCSCAR